MAEQATSLGLMEPTTSRSALKTKTFRLMGVPITVTETKSGQFKEEREFIETNKHLFKYRGSSPKKREIIIDTEITPSLEFPSNLKNAIDSFGGVDLVFIMNKNLEETDVKKLQNRLYIPKSRTLMNYLTEDEKRRIEVQGRDGGLDVIGIDPRGETYNLNLKLWQSYESSNKYVLIKEWAKLVRDNGLVKYDLVEIWCFRVQSTLWIAVVAKKTVNTDLNFGIRGERRVDIKLETGKSCIREVNTDFRNSTRGEGSGCGKRKFDTDLEIDTSSERKDCMDLLIGRSGKRRADTDIGISTSATRIAYADLKTDTSGEKRVDTNFCIGFNGDRRVPMDLEISTSGNRREYTDLGTSGEKRADRVDLSDNEEVDTNLTIGTSSKRKAYTDLMIGTSDEKRANTDLWNGLSSDKKVNTNLEIGTSGEGRANTDLVISTNGESRANTDLEISTNGERTTNTDLAIGTNIGINDESGTALIIYASDGGRCDADHETGISGSKS